MSEINRYIHSLLRRQNLTSDDVARAMQIMTLGGATPAQSSAFLTALRMKGYTSEELAGAINFLSFKQRIHDFKKPTVFISVTSKYADSWIGSAIILASLNIPTYLQFQRSEEMHVGNVLNIDMEADSDTLHELLEELGLVVALQAKPKAFRNILPMQQELEFTNLFDITFPCASPVQPLAIIYEQFDNTDSKLLINSINHTSCGSAVVIESDGIALRLYDNKLYKIEDLNSFTEPHALGVSEKGARLRAFLHGTETLNEGDILRKAAEVLFLTNAVKSVDDGVKLAASAVRERHLYAILDKLIHISNNMGIDDTVENEE